MLSTRGKVKQQQQQQQQRQQYQQCQQNNNMRNKKNYYSNIFLPLTFSIVRNVLFRLIVLTIPHIRNSTIL